MNGLYIHLPFCRKKCHYCNFVVLISQDEKKHDDFLSALHIEMAYYKNRFKNTLFDTLYLGGGTPSLLNQDATNKLFTMIYSHFHFSDDVEITLEANPCDIDEKKAKLYYASGVRRISLGAQTFKDESLTFINRDHLSRDIRQAVHDLREAGFKNINMDLILSLPDENMPDVANSLNNVLKLGPEHVSLYELVVEPGTVFGGRLERGELALPNEDTQIKMLSFARELLKKEGYIHYELLNYAKPGYESKHNHLYWANEEYLGLGPGAFSYLDGKRYQYAKSVGEYLRKTTDGDWVPAEEETLTPERKEIESLLLALRLGKGAELNRFSALLSRMSDTIQSLEKKELLNKDSERLYLTPRGQFFAETVFTELSTL